MTFLKTALVLGCCGLISACGEGGGGKVNTNKTIDYGFKKKDLSQLVAGVWVDPNGCDHWIIDDGIEGYLSQRLDQFGKPVCSGIAPPNTATGPYKGNQTISDTL
ncbi:hypothetical protein [Ascidiaceihabitans sp.]|uniref:hypothetical protein n=1 Tax=Ascidiaceihabitans sp. TaxID=1872644 RepID=UPI003297900B